MTIVFLSIHNFSVPPILLFLLPHSCYHKLFKVVRFIFYVIFLIFRFLFCAMSLVVNFIRVFISGKILSIIICLLLLYWTKIIMICFLLISFDFTITDNIFCCLIYELLILALMYERHQLLWLSSKLMNFCLLIHQSLFLIYR